MRKVLMISVRADYSGGPEHIYRLASEIGGSVEVYFAVPKDVPYWDRYMDLVGQQKMREIPHRKLSLLALLKLRKYIIANKIGIIHSHGRGAGIYSRLLAMITGTTCIHTFHGVHIPENKPANKIYIAIERFFALFTDAFIVVSETEKKVVLDDLHINARKIIVINNGISIPSTRALRFYKSKSASSPLYVVAVSRPDQVKNPELILEIAKILRAKDLIENYRFLIVGDGFSASRFKIEVENERLQDFINFLGGVSDINTIFSKVDCFLSTSKAEGLSLAMLEAFAHGLPVVASDVRGNNELVVHNVNGYLFSLDEYPVAVDYLEKLRGSHGLRNYLGKNGYAMVSNEYRVEMMAQKIKSLYK